MGEFSDALGNWWFKLKDVERIDGRQMNWPHRPQFYRPDSWYLLIVPASESDRIVIDGRPLIAKPGAVIVCAPEQLAEIAASGNSGEGVYVLHVETGQSASDVAAKDGRDGRPVPMSGGGATLPAAAAAEWSRTIYRFWTSADGADRFRSQAGLHELLGLMLRHARTDVSEGVERARQHLDRHFREPATIAALAALAAMSRYHFMRLFKEKYGRSVTDYVTDLRLKRAKQLMIEEGRSPREVVGQVGYGNEAYFRHTFKKRVGISPALYLRNRAYKVAAYSWANIGQLLTLQIIPVAAPIDHYWTDCYRRHYDFEVRVPLSHDYQFNRQALRVARPNQIIAFADFISEEERSRLAEIAPALFLDLQDGWRRHLLLTAEFLDKRAEGESWLARYDRKAAAIRERIKHAARHESVLFVAVCGERIYLWGRAAATVLYDDLHLMPAKGVESIEWAEPVEAERLAECEADQIILNINPDAASHEKWRSLSRSAHWKELTAVRNGQVHRTADHAGLDSPWNEYNAFRHDRMLDELAALFA